ncbi:MAG: SDR family NAD(P)-dependent oxidoreductase [Myxococcaceae bacterium]|nr:SDR family NAD(P)-dependent oxidoreductase [Myxococcaceae bacterium]
MTPPVVPAPGASAPLDVAEVRRAIALLESIVGDRTLLTTLTEGDRLALLSAAGRVAQPERDAQARLAKAVRRGRRQAKQEHDRVLRATTEIRAARSQAVFTAPAQKALPPKNRPIRELKNPRACYVCKTEFTQLHFFYDAMCTPCGDFNYGKRFQRAPLDGKVALITGSRVKIGFQASLMLLRSGAQVIATTRFPNDAAERYSREPDFLEWSHRLNIHGLDLRHAPSVELFARYVESAYPRLDILINNAAQTVRRPPGFYSHMMASELKPVSALSASARPLLAGHLRCIGTVHPTAVLPQSGAEATLAVTWRSDDAALGIHSSAALSQVPYAWEQAGDAERVFPQGRLDADLQQVDLRSVNTWRLTLGEVATAEMLEVHLVNAVAPFILCGKLKGLMARDRREPGHIVNVSAMEGSFSRGTKTDKHPHTNMAKAALNMMTLTSAPDYEKSNIFMNAADTGWVTDEDPAVHADRKLNELDFQPPLDIVDGAARVIDPVFNAIHTGEYVRGLFFKDYKPTHW